MPSNNRAENRISKVLANPKRTNPAELPKILINNKGRRPYRSYKRPNEGVLNICAAA